MKARGWNIQGDFTAKECISLRIPLIFQFLVLHKHLLGEKKSNAQILPLLLQGI